MSAYSDRVEREDEADRLRAVFKAEAEESDADIHTAFWHAATGLLEWQDPAFVSPREYRRLEAIPAPRVVYRPFDKQGEVEAFDLDRDDDECWRGER